MEKLILASASERRRRLLDLLGIPFQVVPSQVQEDQELASSPQELVLELAALKANQVARAHPDRWVIGADTVVCIDGQVLGKPQGAAHARRMLQMLQGRLHTVVTGLCVVHVHRALQSRCAVSTVVEMQALSAREIDWYISTGEPLDKAGAYAIQGKGAVLIRSIQGSYTNVVGLPLTELILMLRDLGAWDLFAHP